jgi:rubrerythrin
MRLVNADDIKYTDMLAPMGNGNYEHVGIVTEPEIDALPTVEAAPVVHGEWLWELAWNGWADHICSVCGYTENTDIHVWLDWRYCPNCGAMMDAGRKDNG